MSSESPPRAGERPVDRPARSDQRQSPRSSRPIRSDADSRRRHQAGEYGEGGEQEATGVGPRRANAEPQVLNDEPGYPDTYGNVEPGRYGVHGYSSSPGHPSAYAPESGVPGAGAGCASAERGSGRTERGSEAADERLRELIRERLTEDPDIDASNITLDIHEGTVTLSGSVSSERARDVVEQCVENCGAKAVRNHLTIV